MNEQIESQEIFEQNDARPVIDKSDLLLKIRKAVTWLKELESEVLDVGVVALNEPDESITNGLNQPLEYIGFEPSVDGIGTLVEIAALKSSVIRVDRGIN